VFEGLRFLRTEIEKWVWC